MLRSRQARRYHRINFIDVLAFAALDDHEAADALAFARARIVNRIAFFQLAGINAEENHLPA